MSWVWKSFGSAALARGVCLIAKFSLRKVLPVQFKFDPCQLHFSSRLQAFFSIPVPLAETKLPLYLFACDTLKVCLFYYSHSLSSLGIYSV